MKTLIFILFLGISALQATPVITSDKKYDPPSDWTINKEFKKQSWWRAFYSQVRPEDFKFSEWRQYYPEHLLKNANITEARFPEIIAEEIKKRAEYPTETKIARVIYLSDGDVDYVVVIQCVMTSKDPKESDAHVNRFFKKESGDWIAGEFSADLSKDPILKLIDRK
jgi:hypothetical protein